jgi:hypothetical protein
MCSGGIWGISWDCFKDIDKVAVGGKGLSLVCKRL